MVVVAAVRTGAATAADALGRLHCSAGLDQQIGLLLCVQRLECGETQECNVVVFHGAWWGDTLELALDSSFGNIYGSFLERCVLGW